MKRALLVCLIAVTALAAPERWFEAYDRGVAAVNAKNYKAGAEALQKSINEMPNEGTNVRAGRVLITYVPHFYLGIAKLNLGDPDGALREFRICEEQGVVARTDYYAKMRDWIAKAQADKQRMAQVAASGSKKNADAAISKALEMQLEALSAGGDRSESYLVAQRKLQEARGVFQKAGTDVNAYRTAEQTAQQAATLFRTATEQGKKQRAARAVAPPPPVKISPAPIKAMPMPEEAPAPIVVPPPATETITPKPSLVPVITEAEMQRRLAEREEKKKEVVEEKPVVKPLLDLRPAYRAFAKGDLAGSERLLTAILRTQPAAEAYLLRGCARYTRAMLSRKPDPILLAATDDFRAALQQNQALRLDRTAFSPKLVDYFESVRKRR